MSFFLIQVCSHHHPPPFLQHHHMLSLSIKSIKSFNHFYGSNDGGVYYREPLVFTLNQVHFTVQSLELNTINTKRNPSLAHRDRTSE